MIVSARKEDFIESCLALIQPGCRVRGVLLKLTDIGKYFKFLGTNIR